MIEVLQTLMATGICVFFGFIGMDLMLCPLRTPFIIQWLFQLLNWIERKLN